jgi:hypothetical protein
LTSVWLPLSNDHVSDFTSLPAPLWIRPPTDSNGFRFGGIAAGSAFQGVGDETAPASGDGIWILMF